MASAIQVGATIPDVPLTVWDKESNKPKQVSTHAVFKGKKAVLFAIPAAFSPGCTRTHCPSYVHGAKALHEKGFDVVAMTAVNDIWTLNAYNEHLKANDSLLMLDGNGEFTEKLGLSTDLRKMGMGVRSRRYAMVLDNLVIKHIALDDMERVTADAILKAKL